MLRNYFQTVFRSFRKNKIYTSLNIIGLAVGFACVLSISLYIHYETTHDKFIGGHEQIFRLSDRSFALTSPAHMEYLVENMDGLDSYAFLLNSGNFTIAKEYSRVIERQAFYASDDFFKVFNYELIAGSVAEFDVMPNAVVITESLASSLFNDENPLEHDIIVYEGGEERAYNIIAVLKDTPTNTHMPFKMIAHMPKDILEYMRDSWSYTIYHGYFRMDIPTAPGVIQSEVDRIYAQRALDNNWFEGIETVDALLASDLFKTPLILRVDDIYLESNLNFDLLPGGNKRYLWVFGATALFVLLLAAINFINLATAQSVKRAKEVGIRKTLGSSRKSLVLQYLTESIWLCLVSAFLALGLVELSLSFLQSFTSFNYSVSLIDNPILLGSLFILAIVTAVLSGLYPAFYLTSFKPAEVLKGNYSSRKDTSFFRNVLVILQFTISLCLGIFMFFVQDQLHYGLEKDPGFEKENLVTLDNSLDQLGDNTESFKNALLNDSRIVGAGYYGYELFAMSTTFVSPVQNQEEIEPFRVYYQRVDADYLPNLGIELLEGEIFSNTITADKKVVIINETMASELGMADPIGQIINFGGSPGQFEIVGITKDMHHQTFDRQVPPTLFVYSHGINSGMLVRLQKGDIAASITGVKAIWSNYSEQPLDYHFVDQEFAKLFKKEQQLGSIISVFTGLALLVACLGLLGLAGYTAEQKTKEIGIRKSLGASIEQILVMFSGRFAKMVLVAMLLAAPIGFYSTNLWLNTFAYKVEMTFWPFLMVGVIGLFIVLTTVSYHMIIAATANPVNALRDE